MAAAYAEGGDFKKAVKWQKKAMKANGTLVYKTKQQEEESRRRLKSYEEGKPFRRQVVEGGKRETPEGDKNALQGSWAAVAGENSKEKFDKELKDIRLQFRGDKLTLRFGGEVLQVAYKLDPLRKPKAIDLAITEGRAKGETMLGIYALEGGDLKLCFSESGQERPTEFAAQGKLGLRALLVLRHEIGGIKGKKR